MTETRYDTEETAWERERVRAGTEAHLDRTSFRLGYQAALDDLREMALRERATERPD